MPKSNALITPTSVVTCNSFTLDAETIQMLSKVLKNNELTITINVPPAQNTPTTPMTTNFVPPKLTRESIPDYACPICIQTVHTKVFVELNTCKHFYHEDCLDLQIKSQDFNCKVCKIPYIENNYVQYKTF